MDVKGIIYLIRHTKTVAEEGICYGRLDLTTAGCFDEQVSIIRKKMEGVPVGKIYSSPLRRCKQLAHTIGKKVICDNRIAEMDFGDWEGQSWNEIFLREDGKRWFADYLNERCPGGESFRDLCKRVKLFAEEIPLDAKSTVIVTHSGVIRSFLAAMDILPEEEIFTVDIAYGQIVKIENREFELI